MRPKAHSMSTPVTTHATHSAAEIHHLDELPFQHVSVALMKAVEGVVVASFALSFRLLQYRERFHLLCHTP